jgi:hypothetical protein
LHRAGELVAIRIPSPEEEAVRDLCRTRADMVEDLTRARNRLGKFLLRHGRPWRGGSTRTHVYQVWLRSQRFDQPAMTQTFGHYLAVVEVRNAQLDAVEADTRMVAKVPPHANAGRFGKHDFTVDLSDPTRPRATCPAGVTTTEVRGNGKDRRGRSRPTLFFPASACGPCSLRARCVGGTGPRSLMLNPHEGLLQQARAAEQTPLVRRKLRRRPIIERKIAHLKRHGLGKARWVGRRRVELQARLTAMLVNLERLLVLDGFASGGTARHAA